MEQLIGSLVGEMIMDGLSSSSSWLQPVLGYNDSVGNYKYLQYILVL